MDRQMENFLFYNTKFGKFNLMIDLKYLFCELLILIFEILTFHLFRTYLLHTFINSIENIYYDQF